MKQYVMSLRLSRVIAQLSLLFLLVSCSQEDSVYSCNPEIDLWVKENKEAIEEMPTDEFLSLERSYQKASYLVLSPEQRKNLWVEKLTETLKLDWNKEEKGHLEKLLIGLKAHSSIFLEDCTEEDKGEFKVFVYQWAKEGEETFGWSSELIRNLLLSPNPLLNKKGEIKEGKRGNMKMIKTRSENQDKRNCDCYSPSNGEGMLKNDCSSDSWCVGSSDCNPKWAGCGIFYLDPCDGYCM